MQDLSVEQSKQFAAHFETLKMMIHSMDWEYAELLVKKLREQADWQENMMIFNPSYPPGKTELLGLQADALDKFVQGVKLLKECDEKKREVESGKNAHAEIVAKFL